MNNLVPSNEVNMELVYRKLIFSETEIPTQLDIPSEESDTVISCDSILESVFYFIRNFIWGFTASISSSHFNFCLK